jgi:prophage regulatory protein
MSQPKNATYSQKKRTPLHIALPHSIWDFSTKIYNLGVRRLHIMVLTVNHWSIAVTYMTFNELRAKLGNRGRSTIYRDVEFGRLPKPIKFGARLSWIERDVEEAIQKQAG